MSVLLPNDAKYIFFKDTKQDFNYEWNFNWSFTCRIESGIDLLTENDLIILAEDGESIKINDPLDQYGFSTFLSKNPDITSAKYGHYMGFFDNSDNLTGEVCIAIDTTGLFALSSSSHPNGVGNTSKIPYSLIVRDITGVIFNEPLSKFARILNVESMNDTTLRFRYVNNNEIVIDVKKNEIFTNVARVPVTTSFENGDKIYPYFFYTCPVSSDQTPDVTFYMNNFHVQGNTNNATYA
jgi:hypothetical protein